MPEKGNATVFMIDVEQVKALTPSGKFNFEFGDEAL
jgi:hypothetical protein